MISLINKDYANKQYLMPRSNLPNVGKLRMSALMLLVLSGCAVAPSTSIQQPMTARPQPVSAPLVGNGSIYQAGYGKLFLFEDRRARSIGDTLTIAINEKDSSSTSTSSTDAHSGKSTLALSPGLLGITKGSLNGLQGTNTSDTSYKDSAANANTNTISGALTVTVIDILSNGNLVVSGEKQVAIGEKTNFVRLSGVVNPNNINASNTVNSSNLADARIEFKDSTSIDGAKLTSMLARFFLSVAF
ncbi:MAG: flagellar basal body L-ring protein FlgH [Sulfuricellaceae bacterium]